MTYSSIAKEVFSGEIECLCKLRERLGDNFEKFAFNLDKCRGYLIWSGIGKSGYICRKIVATMQSLGIKALYLHPSEALHGDLGVISPEDIVIFVSNSGETKELLDAISPIKNIGAKIFSIVGRVGSSLEQKSDMTLILEMLNEVYLDIVPTTSTTSTLVIGDALAVSIAQKRGFTKEEFGKYHPSGQLGKKLTLRVKDVMLKGAENSVVLEGSTIEQVIFEMCKKSIGAVSVTDKSGLLKGVFTDGDLRRFTNQSEYNPKTTIIDDVMIKQPITIDCNQLLYDAITQTISKHSVSVFPVVNKDGVLVGTLRAIDVLKTGLL